MNIISILLDPDIQFYKYQDVAKIFSVSERTISASRGEFSKLRHTTINNRPRIPRSDVEALIEYMNARARAVDEIGSTKLLKNIA